MDISYFYNLSDTMTVHSTPVDENGNDCGLTTSHHLARVQSQVIRIDKFREFLRDHYKYAHSYKYMMDEKTFKMFMEDRGCGDITVVVPDELYVDGLQVLVISPHLKIGEILAIPHHDFEEYEPMLIG